MRIDGGCHCGRITFEAETETQAATICHCTDCQRLTGTAFRVVVPVKAKDFKLLSGQPKTYVKTGDSGRKRAQIFCGDCGTPIYATTADGPPDVMGVRLGTVRQRAEFTPKAQIWHRSALPWVPSMEGLPTKEKD